MKCSASSWLFILSILLVSTPLMAQQRRIGPPPWTMANSPEKHEDGTVSFRIWAPNAEEVTLESELLGGQPSALQRGENDMWSIRVMPASAGLFKYRFFVDGVNRSVHVV